jgi:tetratricopeptide (TPR) repeat protein
MLTTRVAVALALVCSLVAGFCLTTAGAALAAPAPAGPRPLTDAERQGVVFAAEYLERGPAAWWDHLSRTSPLRRLGREAALAEIEVRAGSPAEAQWELQAAAPGLSASSAVFSLQFPSGLDDTLILGLVPEDGGWKIDSLSIAADPVAATAAADGPPGGPDSKPAAAAPRLARRPLWMLGGMLGIGLVLLLAAWDQRPRRGVALGLGIAGALVVLGAVAAAFLPRGLGSRRGPGPAGPDGEPAFAELRSLLPLRRALTQPGGTVPEAAPAAVRAPGAAGRVASLWWAQHLLGRMDFQGVDGLLAGFPSPGRFPLAELLRARLAFLRLQEMPTATAYQRAVTVGAPQEGLLSESAQAFLVLGFQDHAREFLRQLQELGSRRADTYLALAELAVRDHQIAEGEDFFRTAWRLQPSLRSEVMDRPVLLALFQDAQIRRLVHLEAAAEPVVGCAEASRRALSPPAGFEASLLGETLRLTRGPAELRVPGGCDLAPQGTRVDHAGIWHDEREEKLLAGLPALLAAAGTPGALAQPSLRRQTEGTAEALAGRQRWADVLKLTEGLAQEVASLPSGLMQLRAEALRRAGRTGEARELLVRVVQGDRAGQRMDPGTLYQLADLLAAEGNFDTALKLVAKANAQLPYEAGDERIRQLQMEKRLAASSEIYRSPHFEIHYPPLRGDAFARDAARILEAERSRLQAWIPLSSSKITEVHLLHFDDFQAGYSPGLDILGLYDGKIRVPLGDAPKFVPFVVSILTHELAHAMIAERTGDRAPHWFQEGLAQHVEMFQQGVNPIQGYRDKGNLLGFPLLEPAIGSLSPAFVAIGYDESRWTLHYVEHRYGREGIHRLLNAFNAGKTTPEAIATLGPSTEQFDHDLWQWGVSGAPEVWKVDLVRYDGGK